MGNESVVSIVADDESIREAVASLLRSSMCPSRPSRRRRRSFDRESCQKTACVILDVQMPGMDGFGLQQRLVADNRRIPVVFLTAHGDGAARARATRAGVVGFLRKPFDEEALLGVVHSVLTSASSD